MSIKIIFSVAIVFIFLDGHRHKQFQVSLSSSANHIFVSVYFVKDLLWWISSSSVAHHCLQITCPKSAYKTDRCLNANELTKGMEEGKKYIHLSAFISPLIKNGSARSTISLSKVTPPYFHILIVSYLISFFLNVQLHRIKKIYYMEMLVITLFMIFDQRRD